MKAIVYEKYGSPDVLQLKEVTKPSPKDNEVLIRIYETIVTSVDCINRKGTPLIIRLFNGFTKPNNTMPGSYPSGEIEAVGKNVKLFKKGDRVFGFTGSSLGAHAEYKCLPEEGVIGLKPTNITYGEAAAVLYGALTALIFLRDKIKIHKGQKILIIGAAGGIGTFAVQLAKYFGAEVTGICSTKNLDLVKSLGADHVIDYTTEDFTKSSQTYDYIFDTVGKSSFFRCKSSLKQNGVYLLTIPTLSIMLQMLWTSKFSSKKAVFAATSFSWTQNDLNFLIELIESSKLKSVIDRSYPLEQIAEAHKYVEQGHKKGNVVITL
ncbi:NAD(P)-dependent alcohol dehydrogenase [Chengkuizengella sediminis]|uniref:NAD(P)-dependent alcohol dehydrogenase n=1 Tax=Chengkuizengella sediminis TaxID=1885917 RepID=UPI0013893CF2|nr:NAD(P)-dependent alcohol dehydrogenase [Chengkuizengella sediminis]NDI33972.1 NAD(P)-dependent alcohol dehydrogenase [Chengkuizengella sediminis]